MIEFTKAHACGNDFLIVDAAQVGGRDLAQLAREMCARTTGIGADGVEYLTQTERARGTHSSVQRGWIARQRFRATARAAWRRGWRIGRG